MTCVLVGGANKWPTQWNQQQEEQLKITSFCISSGYMTIGRKGGRVEMFVRDLQESLTEQWGKVLMDDAVSEMALSKQEQLVAVGTKTNGKILILDVLTGTEMVAVWIDEGVTKMVWDNQKLFVGGNLGTVAVVEEDKLKQVLNLDSNVVQLAVAGEVLVVSTKTRAVLANTNNKTFREIGSKLRHGDHGVVVVGNRLWAARPGARLWEVDIEAGTVLATRQYKKALSQIPNTPIQNLTSDKNRNMGEHCFSSLITDGNGIVVTCSEDGNLYILDMYNSGVVAWAGMAVGKVSKMMILQKTIVLLSESGVILSVCFGELQDVLKKIHYLQLDQLCGEVLLKNRKSLQNMTSDARDAVLSLKAITNCIEEPDKRAKLWQVFEILSTWQGRNDSMRRRVSSAPHQPLPHIYNGYRQNRSMSQERNPHKQGGSKEGIMRDDVVSGKCHSQEDLLVSGRRQSAGLTSRSLSLSRRNISASEQGLQALQLYNMKCGGKARSLHQSPLTSRNVSAERLEQDGFTGSTRRQDQPVTSGRNSSQENLRSASKEMVGDEYYINNGSQGSGRPLNLDRLEQSSIRENLEDNWRKMSEDCSPNDRDFATQRTEDIASFDDQLKERLEEKARQVGLQIHMNKVGKRAQQDKHKIDYNELWERQESRNPFSEWDFCSSESPGDLDGAHVIGSSITAQVEKLVETGAKIASESPLAGIVSSIKDLDSPRRVISTHIDKQLRNSIRIKKIEEIAIVAGKINQSTNDCIELHIKKLATLVIEEYLEQNKNFKCSKSLSSSDDSETEIVPTCLWISQQMKQDELQQVKKCFEVIFSSDINREIFFRPVGEVSVCGVSEPVNLVSIKLGMIYQNKYMQLDKLVSDGLVLVSDLIDPCCILPLLTETDFNTFTFLLRLETSLRPDLSPIQLEQIDERNVEECSNFLKHYTPLDNMATMRYLQHISRLSTACAVDFVHSRPISISSSQILLIAFTYYEFLMTTIYQHLNDGASLSGGVDVELSSFLALLISSHVGGHVSAWAAMCKKHHNLNIFLTDVFTSANSTTLNQGKNIIGAHRCQRGLQIAPLGEFLIKMLGIQKEEYLDFCKKTFFMSGFVRSILLDPVQAPKEIPLLVELGDPGLLLEAGLLETNMVTLVVEHLLAVYGHSTFQPELNKQEVMAPTGEQVAWWGTTCPIQWDELAQLMLERAGPSITLDLLKSASHVMKPSTLSARFYSQLIIENITHKLDTK